jgi:hypothetical protein
VRPCPLVYLHDDERLVTDYKLLLEGPPTTSMFALSLTITISGYLLESRQLVEFCSAVMIGASLVSAGFLENMI